MKKAKPSGSFARRLALVLAGVTLIILTAHLFMQYINLNVYQEENGIVYELSNRLDLDDELSIPTWFSQTILFTIGISAFVAAYLQTHKATRRLWAVIGTLGVAVSLDEASGLHEFVLQVIHNTAFLGEQSTIIKNAWWFILPFIIIFGIAFLWQCKRLLPRRTVSLILLGGVVFITGAVIVDILGSGLAVNSFFDAGIMVGIEETLELFGSIIVLFAIIDYIETRYHIQIKNALKQLKPR